MIWLAGQLWPLLLLSAVLGALCVAIWGQRRVAVEVWEEVPVPPAREPVSWAAAGVVIRMAARSSAGVRMSP